MYYYAKKFKQINKYSGKRDFFIYSICVNSDLLINNIKIFQITIVSALGGLITFTGMKILYLSLSFLIMIHLFWLILRLVLSLNSPFLLESVK